MSKKAKVNVNLEVTAPIQSSHTIKKEQVNTASTMPLLFSSKNYRLMAIGLGVMFLGLILMMGQNNNVANASFPAEEIYSTRRIIIAPIVIILGFLIELYAILLIKKGK